jgi:hypothetical protein
MKNCGDKMKVDRTAILNAYYEECDRFDRHKPNTDRAFDRSAQFREHGVRNLREKTPT